MEQGKLKAFKTPGGRRRISKGEFERFISKYIREREKGNGFKKSDFIRLGEVARHFGVSNAAVRIWIKQGKLKAIITPGGHRRIRKEDFKKFIKKYPRMPDPA
jgi:excisionase family DNA binding protein